MLDLKFVRDNFDVVKENMFNKNATIDTSDFLKLEEKRRELISEVENLKNKRNITSKEISSLKIQKINADEKIAEMKGVSDKIKEMDEMLRSIENEINKFMLAIPNMLHSSVPIGKTANDNIIVKQWGTIDNTPTKNHIEIAKELNIIDFDRGVKVAGSGFAFYVGKGAKLERALINFFLETHIDGGYTELMPPFLVNRNAMIGTGQLPKMQEDMYHCADDDLFLIPTAEVPLTNFYQNEILNIDKLPVRVCGYSPCFRREAGSYGKDTHGFLRVHQFNKVELVNISVPEKSSEMLDLMLISVESILQKLNLPHRILLLCSGDTSFCSSKTFDFEVWANGERQWLECSSCSNFDSFQARRSNIRFKRNGDSKPEFAHTLNGSGLATSRIMVAIIENFYKDGAIHIPEVLQQYCGFKTISK